MRKEPRESEEMISMLLFGEVFSVLESNDNWHKIKSAHDEYEGWIYSRKIRMVDEGFILRYTNEKPVYLYEPLATALGENEALKLTLGARLPLYKNGNLKIGESSYTLQAEHLICERAEDGKAVVETAKRYMHTPYLWGGRSVFGIDCSGLTQMVYKMNGIQLKRDAWQQAEQGIKIGTLAESQAGDLAFFAKVDKISHVGILTGDGHVLHAGADVRIEKVSEEGIFNKDIEEYTLKLVGVQRYV